MGEVDKQPAVRSLGFLASPFWSGGFYFVIRVIGQQGVGFIMDDPGARAKVAVGSNYNFFSGPAHDPDAVGAGGIFYDSYSADGEIARCLMPWGCNVNVRVPSRSGNVVAFDVEPVNRFDMVEGKVTVTAIIYEAAVEDL